MADIYAIVEKKEKTVFAISTVLLLFWVLGRTLDLQMYKIVGSIFAFLWIPMVIMLFILPVINLTMLIKHGINVKAYWIYGILVNGLTLLLLCKLP